MEVTIIFNETVYTEEMSTVYGGSVSHGFTTTDSNGHDELPFHLRIILLVSISVILVVGVTGNILALYIFLKTKALRTPPNFLIVNLSVSDLAMIISNCPMMLASVHYGYWHFGDIGCSLYAFFGATFSFVSIGTMAAIALDRYYVICHCFHALMNVSRNRTFLIIFLVWLYACLWSVPPFVGIGSYVEEGYGIGCTFDFVTRNLTTQIHIALLYIGGFVSPVITIVICYGKIVASVRKHRKELERYSKIPSTGSATSASSGRDRNFNQSKTSNGISQKRNSQKLSRLMAHFQLTRVGIIATVVFSLSWGPYAIIALYSQFFAHKKSLDTSVQIIPVLFAKMSCIWNPFVYALSHKRFKKALIKTVCGAVRCGDNRSANGTDSQEFNLYYTASPDDEKSASSLRRRSNAMQSLPDVPKSASTTGTMKLMIGHRHSDPGTSNPYKPSFDTKVPGTSTPKGKRKIELEVISGSSLVRDVSYRKSWHPQSNTDVGIIANNYV